MLDIHRMTAPTYLKAQATAGGGCEGLATGNLRLIIPMPACFEAASRIRERTHRND